MIELKAIIQPFQLNQVIEALQRIEGLPGVTVSEVRGFGKARAANAEDKMVEGTIEYARKAKLEIVIPEHLLDRVLQTILDHAHTGNPGDGKIFVSEIIDVVKIRTGERGEGAI
jgi:nitrogen regulatory protein P-II 1